jgi:twinkle protein
MALIDVHRPCTECGSSDAKAYDDKGYSYCFACGVTKKDGPAYTEPLPRTATIMKVPEPIAKSITDRCIMKSTLERYRSGVDGADIVFRYGDSFKVRSPDKRFRTVGAWKESVPLFGADIFPAGGARSVTLCEGEIDAMSAFQMNGGYPVLSIKNGATAAVKDCQNAYEYLDSFDDIVVCFDADDAGKKAAKAVCELFAHKARLFEHVKDFKDANDYLCHGAEKDYQRQWYNARRYLPEGIIGADTLLEALQTPIQRSPLSYPFDSLNKMTCGIRFSELVTFCAGSGLGKTTVLREVVDHILLNSGYKIGLMFLEETPERTMRGLVGLAINKPIHLPEIAYDAGDITRAYESRGYADRVLLWDHFGSNSIEAVLSRMRYLVKACGVNIIVLDHLSMLVSDQAVADERKAIDEIMTKLRTFVQEVNVCLLLVSHLKRVEGKKSLEDGAVTSLGMLRGSAAIAQLSDIVISAERDSQAENAIERNTTHLRVLKNRYSGLTGPCCDVYYDASTGRLREI